jgi:sugar phosphate isomerase/epimerase
MVGWERSISRRDFVKVAAYAAGTLVISSAVRSKAGQKEQKLLRLGGPVFESYQGPDGWAQAVKKLGYSAAYCPVGTDASDDVVKAYAGAAEKSDIIIAETGAWSNPISSDGRERKAALEKCRTQLALADRIGARCCVNISGSRGESWDGPSEKNLTRETFDMVVETARAIIDDVKPTRTFFTLETMPWAYPDSPDSYLQLIKAIDRRQFAVHLDPVNLVCSPQRYYKNAELIRECFEKLGPHIRSCHAKDILLRPQFMTHLDEVRPGLGGLDYATFLRELAKLGDIPIMLEHLPNAEEYHLAAEHIRSVAKSIRLSFT